MTSKTPHFHIPIIDNINGIKRYVVSPCSVPAYIYVETFFPVALMTLLMWLDQFTGIALMRAKLGHPQLPPFDPLFHGQGPFGNRGKGRRGCQIRSDTDPVQRIQPSYQDTGIDKITRALFVIERTLFTVAFWYSVAEITSAGLYNWMSLAHRRAGCDPDPEDGPFSHPQILDAAFHATETTLSFDISPPRGSFEGPQNVIMEPGKFYGYMATTEVHPSPFAKPGGYSVINKMRQLGGTQWIEINRHDGDATGKPFGVGVIALERSHSPFLPTFEIKTSLEVQCIPPQVGLWCITSGGVRVVWRA